MDLSIRIEGHAVHSIYVFDLSIDKSALLLPEEEFISILMFYLHADRGYKNIFVKLHF